MRDVSMCNVWQSEINELSLASSVERKLKYTILSIPDVYNLFILIKWIWSLFLSYRSYKLFRNLIMCSENKNDKKQSFCIIQKFFIQSALQTHRQYKITWR